MKIIFSFILRIEQSTAVIQRPSSFGRIQARPTGSGSLEINTSPSKISLQLSLSKVSEEIKWYFPSLSLKFPKPILPVWIKRIPVSDWSFDSIQSPSPI